VRKSFKDVPVLIIGYARIAHIESVISKLESFGVRRIFVALDYSEDPQIHDKQLQFVRQIGNRRDLKGAKIEIWLKSRNHGIAVGVISAIDWFFDKNDFGVILEDDLDFNRDFLNFCTVALNRYEKDPNVLMISGSRFEYKSDKNVVSAVNYPQIWGWATWRAKWQVSRNLIVRDKRLRLKDSFRPKMVFFYIGAKRALLGLVDTWDLPLAYEMRKESLVCVLPPVNLVENIGDDIHAIHTTNANFPMRFPISTLAPFRMDDVSEMLGKLRESNKFLEDAVFKIRWFHAVSHVKFLLMRMTGQQSVSNDMKLESRLIRAEKHVK
jgi:hypothetical protein